MTVPTMVRLLFYTTLSAVYAESEMAAVNLFLCSRAGSGKYSTDLAVSLAGTFD